MAQRERVHAIAVVTVDSGLRADVGEDWVDITVGGTKVQMVREQAEEFLKVLTKAMEATRR